MTSHEIFSRMPAVRAVAIFTYLQEKENPLYKATIDALAKNRKLRPVFVERKPRGERHAWMQEAMGRKSGDAVAAQILQIWLVGQYPGLLCDFLDLLGIKHDENGTVEELPAAPPSETLKKAVDTLYQKHDPEIVTIYLHAFHALNEPAWPDLGEILQNDPRLKL